MSQDLLIELQKFSDKGKPKEFYPSTPLPKAMIELRGKKCIDFSSWDILNLNAETSVKRAAQQDIEARGVGSRAARFSSGTSPAHLSAEHRIAQFLGFESALLFSSKNQAILSLVTALLHEKDIALTDETLQSPVADAAYVVNAESAGFDSQDSKTLEKQLERTKNYRGKFVFVESLSPLTGKKVNIQHLATLTLRAGAPLIVDESYALGFLGLRGAGGIEAFGAFKDTFCVIGDLSLGVGCSGAFVAGPKSLTTFLANRSRTFSSETAIPSSTAAAIEASINSLELKTAQREKVLRLSNKLHQGLNFLRAPVLGDGDTPILTVSFNKITVAREFAEALFNRGYFIETASVGALLTEGGVARFLINAEHSDEQIDQLLNAIADVFPKLPKG